MVGNHDDRTTLVSAVPDVEQNEGFIQSWTDIDAFRLILLDTLWPGNVSGMLCDARLSWLDKQLATAWQALLFLHHPPMAIGIPSLDECRLSKPNRLLAIIRKHGNVRHVFAGHVHRLSHGIWEGVPFTTLRSTNHQTALNFSGPHQVSFEAPAYAVALIDDGRLVVHGQEFRSDA